MAFLPVGAGGGVQRDTREYGAAVRSCACAAGAEYTTSAVSRAAARGCERDVREGDAAAVRNAVEIRINLGSEKTREELDWSCASRCPNLQHRREDPYDEID